MDKRYLLAFGMGAASLALGILVVRMIGLGPALPQLLPPEDLDPPQRSHDLSGPYTYKNLTVYLVHGENVLNDRTPLTLEEAMERGLVIVHETSDVNELEIENISKTDEVYVQAGDIVKGGKQDRVLAVDLIVPARSGRMPIDSFCVEHGRWVARGDESTAAFASSAADAAPLNGRRHPRAGVNDPRLTSRGDLRGPRFRQARAKALRCRRPRSAGVSGRPARCPLPRSRRRRTTRIVR